MIITEDNSYIKQSLIDKGYAFKDIHSVRLDRHFTEEEKQENFCVSHTMATEQWSHRCDVIRRVLANKNTKLMDMIDREFVVYQYTDNYEYNKPWDLFFWCNDLYNVTNGRESGRDMSYVTLTFNDKSTPKDRTKILDRLVSMFEVYPENNIKTIVQYKTTNNDDVIEVAAKKVYHEHEGKWVKLSNNWTGKLRLLGDGYAFFKKGAKKTYYHLDPLAVCTQISV